MAAGLSRRAFIGGGRRRAAWCAVVLAVVLAHGWITEQVAENSLGWGAGGPAVQRMEVAFVRELQPAMPPVAAAKPRPPRHKTKPRVAAAEPAASQPDAGLPTVVAEPLEPAASAPALSAAEAVAVAEVPSPVVAPEPAASTSANVAYEWPPSTQLSYTLAGNVNGPVEGWARVQWIRQGSRYQVHMDTRVALIATRRMTSDGELTEQGLRPRRYDEETEVLMGPRKQVTVLFEDDRVLLANGRTVPRPEGVQDTASQLVQLVWLFTTHPERLTLGAQVELPLALAWRVDTWVYDVLEPEQVFTPFGEIPTLHVKPRRPSQPGKVLTVECWFAPTLQYLPVRIRVEQNAQTYLDLVLEKPPLQSAPGG
jgi:hypothetical protein